jgi:hypothetical protein
MTEQVLRLRESRQRLPVERIGREVGRPSLLNIILAIWAL